LVTATHRRRELTSNIINPRAIHNKEGMKLVCRKVDRIMVNIYENYFKKQRLKNLCVHLTEAHMYSLPVSDIEALS
jgi:metal-dependent HD superfamily phosphatase/phosphodiesterase